MEKSGAKLIGDCWYCEYEGEFKTCATPMEERKPAGGGRPRAYSKPVVSADPIDIYLEAGENELPPDECDSGDEKPGALGFRFAGDDGWASLSRSQNPAAGNVDRERLPPQEISVVEGSISDLMGETEYYITANSLKSVATIRRKHSERSSHWGGFLRSKQSVDGWGVKKLNSCSRSSLSLSAFILRVCEAR